MHEIELTGLDGSNLLAFLAALGTLRGLALAEPDAAVKMSWRDRGFWMPVVHHSRIDDSKELVDALAARLCKASPGYAAADLKAERSEFRERIVAAFDNLPLMDELAAVASEFIPAKENRPAPTLFNAIGIPKSGKATSGFTGYVKQICSETTPLQIDRSLCGPWTYEDSSPMMRWDPNELRIHALRAKDPAPDQKNLCEKGANRLAIEALALFPVFPVRRSARTVAFEPKGEFVRWPIWTSPTEIASIRSLLSTPLTGRLNVRGVVQVFESKRIWGNDYYLNFLPSRALL